MTPLAAKIAGELTLPKAKRSFDDQARVLDMIGQEMHCFEITAISKSINAVLDDPLASEDEDEAWSVWRDIESMIPTMFLPSPVTWLEQRFNGSRLAIVLQQRGTTFDLIIVCDSERGPFSVDLCSFRTKSILEPGERIEVEAKDVSKLWEKDESQQSGFDAMLRRDPQSWSPAEFQIALANKALIEKRVSVLERRSEILHTSIEVLQGSRRFIGMTVLALDLINTPGIIGLKQRDINKKLARRLSAVGTYPLRAWSEVVLKHQTKRAEPGEERLTGTTYHKCLHFVRSHLRHYQDGHVTLIPAHWRGDPALGIKRTRYRVAA